MESGKLTALLRGHLTQQEYLSQSTQLLAPPPCKPELETLSSKCESDAESEVSGEGDEGSATESDDEGEDDDDDDEDDGEDEEDDDDDEEIDDDEEDGDNEEDEDDDEEEEGDDEGEGRDDDTSSNEVGKESNDKEAVYGIRKNGDEKLTGIGDQSHLDKEWMPGVNNGIDEHEKLLGVEVTTNGSLKPDMDDSEKKTFNVEQVDPVMSVDLLKNDQDLLKVFSEPFVKSENGDNDAVKSNTLSTASHNLLSIAADLGDSKESKENKPDKDSGVKTKSKKLKRKRKRADGGEKKTAKKRKKGDSEKVKKKKKRKRNNERRNIRKILLDNDLDHETRAAQQEEKERKKRLQELQRNVANNMHLKALLESDSGEEEVKEDNDVIIIDKKDDKSKRWAGKYGAYKSAKDVINISSDDDDVVMVETKDEEVEEDDPNNSGLHVNDALNIPDDEGRVLINVGHPSDEPDIFLAPQIAKVIRPHQIGGVRFLYDNLVESLNRFKSSNGFGCILAHSMGLGKTIQVIAFIDIFLRNTEAKNVLCIVPINTLQNWIAEFAMWCPESENSADAPADKVWPREFRLFVINDNHKTTEARAAVVQQWVKKGGVLLMGYEMYRLLATRKPTKSKKKPGRKTGNPMVIDLEQEDRNKELSLDIQLALLRPGPDLVVCDEGHRIKNSHASISQALKSIRTRRRVVLTGYPLQNNLLEYWCMVDFVRPNYLGTKGEFCNMFERPIMNGQCVDSTGNDARIMRQRAHVLHSLLEGFVQRRGHTVLQSALPCKTEIVLLIRMSPIQRKLYSLFMDSLNDMELTGWATTNPLKAFSVCCKIWNHPDIFYKIVKQMRGTVVDDDLDIGETDSRAAVDGAPVKKGRGRKKKNPVVDSVTPPDIGMNPFPDRREQSISYEWADEVLKSYVPGALANGGKMVILFNIIQETILAGEKLLVFSQSLFTLNLIEEYLGQHKVPNREERWSKNTNYFRLDGSTSSFERERLINLFNSPENSKVHLFLLSTRAGCLGINLVGANRVVVFDASWNPCHDCQAVCRVYRYGQTKPCFIYRLVSDNSLEKKIYERQINKQGMADRVVDEMNPQNNFTKKQVESLLHYQDIELPHISMEDVEKNVDDKLMQKVLENSIYWLTKEPFSHESLLIDQQDLKLSKAEKRLARQSYEREKKMNLSNYPRPSYQAYYPKGMGMHDSFAGIGRSIPLPTAIPNPGVNLPPPQSMSTPVPMQIRPGAGSAYNRPVDMNSPHSMNHSGVTVNQVITTTEIVVPATNTATDSTPQIRIPPGKQILVIKTAKGVYIRTPEGKIFAVRGGNRLGVRPKTLGASAEVSTASVMTPTTSAVSVSLSNSDSHSGYEARPVGSPRAQAPIPSSVFDMTDGSSQDSVSSSTTGGMTGLLRSALMKGRSDSARPPSQMSTSSGTGLDQALGQPMSPGVAPSPLSTKFSSLSTSSRHHSPVQFTQGLPSRFRNSPMENLVSLARSGSKANTASNEEGENINMEQEGHFVSPSSKGRAGAASFPGYFPSRLDYKSLTLGDGMNPSLGHANLNQAEPVSRKLPSVPHFDDQKPKPLPKGSSDGFDMKESNAAGSSTGFSMEDLLGPEKDGDRNIDIPSSSTSGGGGVSGSGSSAVEESQVPPVSQLLAPSLPRELQQKGVYSSSQLLKSSDPIDFDLKSRKTMPDMPDSPSPVTKMYDSDTNSSQNDLSSLMDFLNEKNDLPGEEDISKPTNLHSGNNILQNAAKAPASDLRTLFPASKPSVDHPTNFNDFDLFTKSKAGHFPDESLSGLMSENSQGASSPEVPREMQTAGRTTEQANMNKVAQENRQKLTAESTDLSDLLSEDHTSSLLGIPNFLSSSYSTASATPTTCSAVTMSTGFDDLSPVHASPEANQPSQTNNFALSSSGVTEPNSKFIDKISHSLPNQTTANQGALPSFGSYVQSIPGMGQSPQWMNYQNQFLQNMYTMQKQGRHPQKQPQQSAKAREALGASHQSHPMLSPQQNPQLLSPQQQLPQQKPSVMQSQKHSSQQQIYQEHQQNLLQMQRQQLLHQQQSSDAQSNASLQQPFHQHHHSSNLPHSFRDQQVEQQIHQQHQSSLPQPYNEQQQSGQQLQFQLQQQKVLEQHKQKQKQQFPQQPSPQQPEQLTSNQPIKPLPQQFSQSQQGPQMHEMLHKQRRSMSLPQQSHGQMHPGQREHDIFQQQGTNLSLGLHQQGKQLQQNLMVGQLGQQQQKLRQGQQLLQLQSNFSSPQQQPSSRQQQNEQLPHHQHFPQSPQLQQQQYAQQQLQLQQHHYGMKWGPQGYEGLVSNDPTQRVSADGSFSVTTVGQERKT